MVDKERIVKKVLIRTRGSYSPNHHIYLNNYIVNTDITSCIERYCINTKKESWDNLTEALEKLDAPTGFFVRDHIVPILVGISPWGRGVKLVGGIANGVKTAISTETAIKRVAIAAGISEELNRFNILYSKKHSNNSNKNNGNNNSKGSDNNNPRVVREYKGGEYWNKLFDNKDGAKNAGVPVKKIDKILGELKSLKRKTGGEVRADKDGNFYLFDDGHKTAKIHLEKIEKRPDGYYNTAEIDPETGIVLKNIKRFVCK